MPEEKTEQFTRPVGVPVTQDSADATLEHAERLAKLQRGDRVLVQTVNGDQPGVFVESTGPQAFVFIADSVDPDGKVFSLIPAVMPWAFIKVE